MWSQVVTLVTVKDINNYDLDGYFAPSTHYQLIGEEEEGEERRLIDLHGFAPGKNANYVGSILASKCINHGCQK